MGTDAKRMQRAANPPYQQHADRSWVAGRQPMPAPQRRTDLHVQTVGDELIVYDPAAAATYRLNATAGCVLDACDGSRSIEQLADVLTEQFDVSHDHARGDVIELVCYFATNGLLDARPAVNDESNSETNQREAA